MTGLLIFSFPHIVGFDRGGFFFYTPMPNLLLYKVNWCACANVRRLGISDKFLRRYITNEIFARIFLTTSQYVGTNTKSPDNSNKATQPIEIPISPNAKVSPNSFALPTRKFDDSLASLGRLCDKTPPWTKLFS